MFSRIAPACCFELYRANHFCVAILHSHCSNMFDVHIAEKKVIHGRGWPTNQEMLVCTLQFNMLESDRNSFQHAWPRDTHLRVGVHVIVVVLVFSYACRNWWMVANLLCKVLIVFTYQFKSLSEDWIEGLVQTAVSALVLSYAECCNQHNPLDRVCLLIC